MTSPRHRMSIHRLNQFFCFLKKNPYICNQIPIIVVLQIGYPKGRMKKFTAILLLLFMLMSAVQPVLAMHFCGDKLYSFSLLLTTGNSEVCCEKNATQENRAHLRDQYPEDEAAQRDNLVDTHASCCDTQLLKPSTDDYQTKAEPPVSRIASFSYEGIAASLIPLFKLSESKTNTLSFFQDFPPKGLFLQDVRLLTYICIYRI